MNIKVLAFLQNQWFREPEKVRAMLSRHDNDPALRERVRRRLIAYALFAGCLTGRRLMKASGEEWCHAIVWEEANRIIAGDARTFYPPEIDHVVATVKAETPDIVILFGASNHALAPVIAGYFHGLSVTAPHPAARGARIPEALALVRRNLDQLISKKDNVVRYRNGFFLESTLNRPAQQ